MQVKVVCVCGGGEGGGGQGGGGQNLEKVGLAVGNIEEGLHKTGVRNPLPTVEIEMSEQFWNHTNDVGLNG